jgi:Transposase DDE domain
VNRIRQFWHYARKVFDLPRRLRSVRDQRSDPEVPTWAVTASLFLGAFLRRPSFLQIQADTQRWGWQRLIGYAKAITDERLAYVTERYRLEDLRSLLVETNKSLKKNKAFESAKIDGLLVVEIDANEQFKSRSRCCEHCRERKVKIKNAEGQEEEVSEYYHYQVYAHIHGAQCSTVLDIETIRPGEDEARAAVRLLGRMRRCYGPRFFDVVTMDAWYAKGPTIKSIQRLGWAPVVVLKQERYEIYQETTVLAQAQPPLHWQHQDRQIELREVRDLSFTDDAIGPIRVVCADEKWEEVQVKGNSRVRVAKQSHWRWITTKELDGCASKTIWRIGHQRWGVENHLFNELTKFYHLEHCPRHHPVAIMAWLLILVLAFTLFELFARVHGKLWRQGKTTLQDIASELFESLARWEEIQPLWSG